MKHLPPQSRRQGRKSVKQLRQQLRDLAETRERNVAEQNELIAQLKDQLQARLRIGRNMLRQHRKSKRARRWRAST